LDRNDEPPGSEPVRPGVPSAPPRDARLDAAWRTWLSALATDAEAVLAASEVYDALGPADRDAWLEALVEDGPALDVPLVALYAPLLSVEQDPARRERMELCLLESGLSFAPRTLRALRGVAEDGARVIAFVRSLYLHFAEVLVCRYVLERGFSLVLHDPLVLQKDAPQSGSLVEGVVMESTPVTPVVEELAHAVLAHKRTGEELPVALASFADLFDSPVDSERFER
jgi:hypothetical protein